MALAYALINPLWTFGAHRVGDLDIGAVDWWLEALLPARARLPRWPTLAKETGRFDAQLRYPGEDDTYENPKMDALKL